MRFGQARGDLPVHFLSNFAPSIRGATARVARTFRYDILD